MRLPAALGLRFAGAAALGLGYMVAPAAAQIAATPQTMRDFVVQDVCLDAAGAVVIGVAPLPGEARCATGRDLRPGEPLPYHKHDQPSPGDRAGAPAGYQRHDSFPVETTGLGTVVEQSFDFGAGEGRRFGVFDENSDGGDVVVLSPGAVSIGATRDQHGFTMWIGECQGKVTAAALQHSWLVAQFDPRSAAPPLAGETVARLGEVSAVRSAVCPPRFNPAYTHWRVAPFRYRALPGQGAPLTLTTLISEHYGGLAPATADHLERFYFTRELGGTRWERWENLRGNSEYNAAAIAQRAAQFAATGRCSPAPAPGGGAEMVLIDCREWTDIMPPADPKGDPPGFFIDALRAHGDAPDFFAAPPARQ